MAVLTWAAVPRLTGPSAPADARETGSLAGAEVRAELALSGDSLRLVVRWHPPAGSGMVTTHTSYDAGVEIAHQPAPAAAADTVLLPLPPAGVSATGHSCVRAGDRESCTPWQFVRPAARAANGPGSPPDGTRIVIRPAGLQVDPDVGGRCAAWRAAHPDQNPWLAVNREAVPECTGPNGRPTLAQFCAFAELPDGRRTKTRASRNSEYCDQLYQEWLGERTI